MPQSAAGQAPQSHHPDDVRITADVLVIGGGLAGGWAAVAAAQAGAKVVLVDKGFFGASGVTATAGPGHWWVPPDPPEARAEAIRQRDARAFGLADPRWMERIIDMTWRTLPSLAGYYDFPTDDHGVTQYRGLRGPEYMRAMRALATDLGVAILDQSPALELFLHRDGSVAGASGVRRQTGAPWTIRAAGVVLATGGCAFMSRLLGCHTNTGDGLLMAAEAGAELSGMEFSCYYTVSPARSTMTRSMSYAFARYFDEDGRELDIPQGPDTTRGLASAMLDGRVFCSLDRTPEDIRTVMPQVQPNVTLAFDRMGVDPYRQRFEVALRGEGTVRGVGGLRVIDDDCQTHTPGLFAAGDVASRELVAGATSGGGAQNSAWALSSGRWAGSAAARLAERTQARDGGDVIAIGQSGLRPARSPWPVDLARIPSAVRDQTLAYDKNIFRSAAGLTRSLDVLNDLWVQVRDHVRPTGVEAVKTREAAALIATGRWCYEAALARNESRGMHQRIDAPKTDSRFDRRLSIKGLDTICTRLEAPSTHVGATG